jgi:hypothetical protein
VLGGKPLLQRSTFQRQSERSASVTLTRAARTAGSADATTEATSSATAEPAIRRLRPITPVSRCRGCDPDRQPDAELARPPAHRKRQHAGHAHHRDRQRDAAKPPNTSAFSRSGVSTSARMSSSVAARSTGWSADRSRMMRVIGVTSAYGFDARERTGGRPRFPLPNGVIHGQRRARHHVLVVDIGHHADDAPGRRLMSTNFITGSVHIMWRLTAS